MNKAFTKEDAAPEPEIVAPRSPLPPGVSNYVTPRGLGLLQAELRGLSEARDALLAQGASAGGPSERAVLQARMGELEERIASAVLVDPRGQSHQEVRFGARVSVRGERDNAIRQLEIVGVDEADVTGGRIAFIAPLARALLGRRVGDIVTLRTPRGEEELEVLGLAYQSFE